MVFFRRHPERRGQKLGVNEPRLAAEWKTILRDIVMPTLAHGHAPVAARAKTSDREIRSTLDMATKKVPGLGITIEELLVRHQAARVPDHPLAPSMRDAMIEALAASEQFAGHKIALASDGRMTQRGQREALKDALTTTHGKAWARAKAPVAKARAEIKARRSALTVKPIDPANVAAALERQEIRAWVRQLDLGVRQSVVLGTKDRRILEALLSAPPELSGIVDAGLAGKVEDRYIELTYPGELASIEAMDAVVAEAETAISIARNDMRTTIDLHPHDFDALLKPLETIRPWLLDNDRQVCEIVDGKPTYRASTESDRAFGVRYKDVNEYRAAQGLADAA
jgi:hypothetical protein